MTTTTTIIRDDESLLPDGRIRTAVVGLGWAANSIWLPRLHEHASFDVKAIVDPNPAARETTREHVAELGDEVLDVDGVEQLDPESVDLAIVAVPNHLHSVIGGKLLARGIPVFLEKPVCLSAAEAERLAVTEEIGESVLLAGSAARYRADVMALAELLPRVGEIRHVDVCWIRARGVPDAGGWFTRSDQAGGGALLDLGWHLFDTVTPLLGNPVFTQAAGTMSSDFVASGTGGAAWRETGQKLKATGNVEDTVHTFLITEDNVSVQLRAAWASHEPHDHTLLRVEGTDGTAVMTSTFGFSPNRVGGSELTLTHDGVVEQIPVAQEPIGTEYMRQLDALPAQLADPAAPGRVVADTRRTVSVIENVYRSARLAQGR